MSPRCQIASTEPAWARTASRASRLLWTSEMTAIRIRPNLAAGRSPGPTFAQARISWVRGRDAATGLGDHQAMTIESWNVDRMNLQVTAAQGRHRAFGGCQLGRQVASLPGNEQPARLQQRKGQLDELGEAADRPRPDRRPLRAVALVSGQCLGAQWCCL